MRKMKDSGIEWIGEIPEGWEVRRIKYCADSPVVKVGESNTTLKYIGLENIVSGNGRFIDTDSEYDKSQALLFQANDILWGKLRPYLAKVFHAIEEGCCSSEFCILRINNNYSARYFWNLLISPGFVDTVNQSTYGSKMPRANESYIRGIYIPLPPLTEQERIADYLDEKCGRIDAAIEKQKQVIEKLQEYKRSLITQTVTKGLNPKAKMKDSGIEWIGEIPEDWEKVRIKNVFTLRNERSFLPLNQVNLISLYTDKGVLQHSDLDETNTASGNKASNADGYKKVFYNDIIVNIILCWMGAIGRSQYEGVTSPAYDVYKPSDSIECRYYHYFFRTPGFNGDCYKNGRGIMAMRWRTYSTEFMAISIPLPPLSEQRQIADYLDERCASIDSVIAKKSALIEKLTEYKKSLIYETVTGKREI